MDLNHLEKGKFNMLDLFQETNKKAWFFPIPIKVDLRYIPLGSF